MLAWYLVHPKDDPLDGYLEVPRVVGEVVHSSYFSPRRHADAANIKDEPSDYRRELLYAFAEIAIPDGFLRAVVGHLQNSQQLRQLGLRSLDSELAEEGIPGEKGFSILCDGFHANGYVAPRIAPAMMSGVLRGGSFTSGLWPPHAPYGFEMGVAPRNGGRGATRGLRRYAEHFPDVTASFDYCERGNGYGTGMCFIARSGPLFVSQRCWQSHLGSDDAKEPWNSCTQAFNDCLESLREENPHADCETMVVYSSFDSKAYIVSSIRDAWDEYAPVSRVFNPLPSGFGVVGVWDGFDRSRYAPRSIDRVIAANFSPTVTAAARYLRDCLRSVPGGSVIGGDDSVPSQ
jgi:hypothetical protein